jgi:RHS repeat-associated protein
MQGPCSGRRRPTGSQRSLARARRCSRFLARDADALAKVSRRGYTGHEHLDAVGLIHMGGRVYDPLLGRFLSVDPMLDGVGSAQATNGYAYVHNNPLTYTDPSGYERARPQQLRDPGEVPLAVLDQWEREADARSLSLQRLAAQNGGQLPPMCMTMSCTVNRLLQGFGSTRGPAMVSSIRSAPDLRGTSVTAIDVVTGETIELSQGERTDLGRVGNSIRDQVESPIEKDLFEHYWLGRGTNVELTEQQFGRVVDLVSRLPQPAPKVVTRGDQTLVRRQFAFPPGEFDAAFGTGSVFYNRAERPVGFYDRYNFDVRWRDSLRPTAIVLGVRGACIVAGNCVPFDVTYGQYAKP